MQSLNNLREFTQNSKQILKMNPCVRRLLDFSSVGDVGCNGQLVKLKFLCTYINTYMLTSHMIELKIFRKVLWPHSPFLWWDIQVIRVNVGLF